MQRSIDYRALWKSARAWDVKLGKWAGNRESLNEIDLAFRIIIVGFGLALIGAVSCLVIALNIYPLSELMGAAYGLALLFAGFSLYHDGGFVMAFAVGIGGCIPVWVAGAIFGSPSQLMWNMSIPVWATGFSVLVAIELLRAVNQAIIWGFYYVDNEPEITFRRIRKAGLMSRDEIKALKNYPRWIMPGFCLMIILVSLPILLTVISVGRAEPEAAGSWLVVSLLMVFPSTVVLHMFFKRENNLLAIAINRLGGEAAVRAQLGLPE